MNGHNVICYYDVDCKVAENYSRHSAQTPVTCIDNTRPTPSLSSLSVKFRWLRRADFYHLVLSQFYCHDVSNTATNSTEYFVIDRCNYLKQYIPCN